MTDKPLPLEAIDRPANGIYISALGHVYSNLSCLPAWFRRLTPGQLQDIARLMAHWYAPPRSSDADGQGIKEFADVPKLQNLERDVILRAIRVCEGDMVKAAAALGIGKTTIYRKLREWGYTARLLSQASALGHEQATSQDTQGVQFDTSSAAVGRASAR